MRGLGVAQYAWSTSPLRRYVDLVNQWQILAVAQHGVTAKLVAPFKPKDADLLAAVADFEGTYAAYAEHQSTMERYWCLRWLAQEGREKLMATVLKEGAVRFTEIPLVTRVPELAQAARGTQVLLEIGSTDEISLAVSCRVLEVFAGEGEVPRKSWKATRKRRVSAEAAAEATAEDAAEAAAEGGSEGARKARKPRPGRAEPAWTTRRRRHATPGPARRPDPFGKAIRSLTIEVSIRPAPPAVGWPPFLFAACPSGRSPPAAIVNAVLVAPRHPLQWWHPAALPRALAEAVAIHALLLMVRIAAPEVFEIKRSDPQLDVVLVNSKSAPSAPQPDRCWPRPTWTAAATMTPSAPPRRCRRRPSPRMAT